MAYVNFINNETALNDKNLDKMQRLISEDISSRAKILWELESDKQNAEFLERTILLSSSDYDYLIILAYRNNGGNTNETVSIVLEKEKSGYLNFVDYFGGYVRAWTRHFESIDDMSIKFGQGDINGGANNHILVPYKILGYKTQSTMPQQQI